MKYISHRNLLRFLEFLKKDYTVFAPVKKDNQRFYKKFTLSASTTSEKKYSEGFTDNIVIGEVRAIEPLKAFFTRAREIVAEDFKDDVPHFYKRPFAVVGVKACDLKSFRVQDYVFQDHNYRDPFYMKMREENLIISADCTCAIETCFCLAMDVTPYPQENFDVNLSLVRGGYLVDSGSSKGQALLGKYSSLFEDAKETLLSERDQQRQKVTREVEENIKKTDTPYQNAFKGAVEKKFESDIWKDEAKTCVECGACNAICPTCHCFLLYDEKDEERMARLRIWDSCMIKDFARVAGGANPRPHLWMRLRNRFEKKFDFFPKVADLYACTGCGRCISACPAKIDIRKVLKRLVSDA